MTKQGRARTFLLGVLRDSCKLDIASLKDDDHLQADLGLDSMGLLHLALEIENALQCHLGEDPADPPETVGDLLALVEARLQEQLRVA